MKNNCEVKRITYAEAKPFILNIHYARRMPCVQYAFGLYKDNILVGVVTYGQPASPSLCVGIAGENNKKNVLELNRVCMLPEHNGNNNASYRDKKKMLNELKYPILSEYPKGDSQKYDILNPTPLIDIRANAEG